jgi:filamentous hemagglutinin
MIAGQEAVSTIVATCGRSSACYATYLSMALHDVAATTPELGGSATATTLLGTALAEARATLAARGVVSSVNGFAKTDAVPVLGSRAIDRAQSYEDAVQGMYSNTPFNQRQYQAVVNGERVSGIADEVTSLNGKLTAVEAKYVDDWAKSIRNPGSSSGSMPWAVAEQQNMVSQAQKYAAGFDGGVVYHTNSTELAAYYSKVFTEAGITNFKFVITPTK